MSSQLEWQRGEPKFDGLYLVAVRCPNGLGELDLYNWRGEWVSLYAEEPIPSNYNIIGYASVQAMISLFKGNWPSWDELD